MSTLREAAQQALDRLRMYYYGTGFAEDAECIAALERALARKQAEPTGKQSLQVDHGLNMNTPQAAQRLLDALAAAMPYAPHRAEFDIVADAADDLRAALKRREKVPTQETDMSTLREAAQQALEALEDLSDCYDGEDDYDGECASCHTRSYLPHDADCKRNNAVNALRSALKREEEALAWLEDRKQHWRRERERMQDPELSAALGYPGGISDPVMNRVKLLRMVAEMRLAQLAAPQ